MTTPLRSAIALAGACLIAVAGALAPATAAADSTSTSTDEIVKRVTQEVLKELRDSGQLDKAVDAGIARYVSKRRAAQAAARARQQQQAAALAKNVRPVSATRDHIYGNPKAIVSLIEYSDFECPYCKRFHDTARKLVDDSGGKVNWVYRHFPLSFHDPGAEREAEASECVAALGGNDAFWKYANRIFDRTHSNGNGFPASKLEPLAREIGLDGAKFKRCLESRRFASRVNDDLQEGIAIGIDGTPGNILLNNRTGEAIPRSGALPYATLKETIDQLLSKSS